jgi:pimeloyl-ACP methyl ester carboxylesterase
MASWSAATSSFSELRWQQLLSLDGQIVNRRAETPFRLLRFAGTGASKDALPNVFYALDHRGIHSDTASLIEINVSSGKPKQRVIYAHPRYDVVDVIFDPLTDAPLAVGVYQQRMTWIPLPAKEGGASRAALAALQSTIPPTADIEALQPTRDHWLLTCADDRAPPELFSYEPKKQSLHKICSTNPQMAAHVPALATTTPLQLTINSACTGKPLAIDAYLSLPPPPEGLAPANGPTPPRPLLVLLHGGPFDRDHWAPEPDVHLFTMLGLAVLRINYPGSRGFGIRFENLSFGRLGTAVVDDILGVVKEVLRQHGDLLDPEKIGISGTSAAGYLAIKALSRAPDLFKCGMILNSLVSTQLLLSSSKGAEHAYFSHLFGYSPQASSDQSHRQSGLSTETIEALRQPLLVIVGTEDRIVSPEHSNLLVRALRPRTSRGCPALPFAR